ncbi:MAG: hypothetical protein RR827_05955 [Oscillospiraceae bacterium]
METKTKNNGVLTLALSSAFVNFAVTSQSDFIYPRDRLFNLALSALLNFEVIYFIRDIDFKKNGYNVFAAAFILYRLIVNAIKFSEFFQDFYGANMEVIVLFTAILIAICIKLDFNNILKVYIFFIAINAVLLALVVWLSVGKINVMNLYATSLEVSFKPNKLIFFNEIIIINLLVEEDKKLKIDLNFLWSGVGGVALFTLLQGLCIGGDMLYSISPLQGLMQIFSGRTIKRFDYYIALLQGLNYYGSVMLLMCGARSIRRKKGVTCNENI